MPRDRGGRLRHARDSDAMAVHRHQTAKTSSKAIIEQETPLRVIAEILLKLCPMMVLDEKQRSG